MSTEERLDALEEALMLYLALATGNPVDASEGEKAVAETRLSSLIQGMADRLVAR